MTVERIELRLDRLDTLDAEDNISASHIYNMMKLAFRKARATSKEPMDRLLSVEVIHKPVATPHGLQSSNVYICADGKVFNPTTVFRADKYQSSWDTPEALMPRLLKVGVIKK